MILAKLNRGHPQRRRQIQVEYVTTGNFRQLSLAAGPETSGVQDCVSCTPIARFNGANVPVSEHGRHLRSSSYQSLTVPRTRTTFGDRSFTVERPRLWNSLPATLRQTTSYTDSLVDIWKHIYLGPITHGELWLLFCCATRIHLLTYLLKELANSKTSTVAVACVVNWVRSQVYRTERLPLFAARLRLAVM